MPGPFGIAQPDLAQPLLNAVLTNPLVTANIPPYLNGLSIFTRRPAPPDAKYPMIIISPDIAKTTNDEGYNDQRPIITRDLAVYGLNDNADNYRLVEAIAISFFDQFHRNRMGFTPPDSWVLVDIVASGPIPAPADDDLHVGRVVSLQVRLAHVE